MSSDRVIVIAKNIGCGRSFSLRDHLEPASAACDFKTRSEQDRIDPNTEPLGATKCAITPISAARGSPMLQRIRSLVQTKWYIICMSVIVIFNAIWIGVDADLSDGHSGDGSIPSIVIDVVELVLCGIFVVELSLRVIACHPNYTSFVYHNQQLQTANCVDILITAATVSDDFILEHVMDTTSATYLHLFLAVRVLRLLRIVKLFSYVPVLGVLVAALRVALSSVFAAVATLVTAMYIYALVFTEWADDFGNGDTFFSYFSFMYDSMLTLFQLAVYDDATGIIRRATTESWLMGLLALSFCFIGGFLILNVLIGIIANVVAEEAGTADSAHMTADLDKLFSAIDVDGDDEISMDELQNTGRVALIKLGISEYIVDGLCEVVASKSEVSRPEFIGYMTKMLSPPSSEDLLLIRKKIESISVLVDSLVSDDLGLRN